VSPARALALTLALAGAPAALAVQVERRAVTIGALADSADRVVLARVAAVGPDAVDLAVDRTLKGPAATRLSLPRGAVGGWAPGARAVLFLDAGPAGALRPLLTAWQRVSVPAAGAADLVDAVRGGRPRGGGDPGAVQAALFDQLESSVPRLRVDAALDLLGFRALTPTAADLVHLRRALAAHDDPALLELAGRAGAADLLPAVLAAARGGRDDRARRAAASALGAIDADAAVAALALDLGGADAGAAAAAALTLGRLDTAAARAALADALRDPRPDVRRDALRAVGETSGAGLDPGPLTDLVWDPATDPADARRAVAALAWAAEGAALIRVERGHPDPDLRALAAALRADPVEPARAILEASR